MRLLFFIVSFISGLLPLCAQNTSREVLFMSGSGATSPRWNYFYSNGATPAGYQMSTTNPLTPVGPYNPSAASVAENANIVNGLIANKNNVLGIGHDGGGIVLRQMAKSSNTKLSALILDGVPNQGSNAILQCLPVGNQPPAISQFIDKLEDIKSGAQNCQQCQVIDAFKSWTDAIALDAPFYGELTPQSPTITGLGSPTIPTAVIWGNADKDLYALDRLLSSRSNAASGTYGDADYLDCYRRQLEQHLKTIRDAEIDAIFFAVTGLLTNILKAEGAIKIENGAPMVDTGKIADALAKLTESIYKAVEKIRFAQKETAEMLECELIHQMMNIHWNMITSGGYQVALQNALLPNDCSYCYEQCSNEADQFMTDICISECFAQCQEGPPPTLTTIPTPVFKPSDGLLSRDEQLLAGAVKTYEAKQTNHFQEQSWVNPAISGPFQDLFDGNAGLAFKVPK
jgi:pimeloyl-ACP methyl ester carboxylesterase